MASTGTARFGCRKFEIDPQKGFILNGRPYPLRVSLRHQDRKGAGVAITREMMEEDMALILEMGANTIRLCPLPQHAQAFMTCATKGSCHLSEIPSHHDAHAQWRANTLTQMEELIAELQPPCIAVLGDYPTKLPLPAPVERGAAGNHRASMILAQSSSIRPARPRWRTFLCWKSPARF